MKRRLFPQLPVQMLAVLIALMVGQARVVEAEELEGTWLMEVTLVNCATGAPLPIPGNPLQALRSYTRDGTMLVSPAFPPPAPPTVTRSVGVGAWEHTGAGTYRERFRVFRFGASGAHVGTEEITIERELIRGNSTEADEIVGAGHLKVFSPTGDLIGQGCNQDRGQRFAAQE